ncbi:hypothetical protein BP5796_06875 [Coleophoma crateriformis]|uniref:Uncharacterized protein n=1 Tax=Coleophoma crateriformis TaxID=565419 RepID=A0A3D8RQ94_9HELO|nr:hypothetical protein BP5796_06875 [Coleophoma crateriformis]
MAETSYQGSSGRQQTYAQQEWPALTPYSAVSSFNLPAQYDTSLITPIQNMVSPAIPPRTRPITIKHESVSPATVSPSYDLWPTNDGYSNLRPKSPMKYKVRGDNGPSYHQPRITTAEADFPPSPFFCQAPYFGSFTVSAGCTSSPQSISAATTSPIMARNNEWEGLENFSGLPNIVPRVGTYNRSQAPLLIAPSPSSRKNSSRTYFEPQRQNSTTSDYSTPQTSLPSEDTPDSSPRSTQSSATIMRQQDETSPSQDLEDDNREGPSRNGQNSMFLETQFIVQARLHDRLPWKQVTENFNRRFKKNMHTPALEMRLKRHRDRARMGSDTDVSITPSLRITPR